MKPLIYLLSKIFAPIPENKVTGKGIIVVGEWLTKLADDSSFTQYQQIADFKVLVDAMLNEYASHHLYPVYQQRINDILHFKQLLIEWQFTNKKELKK